jgi:hypothetical protein
LHRSECYKAVKNVFEQHAEECFGA